MKIVIDIPDEIYDDIKRGYICSEYADTLIQLIPSSKPYEEQPQGEWKTNKSGYVYCSECNTIKQQAFNKFCSFCGVSMKKGGAE